MFFAKCFQFDARLRQDLLQQSYSYLPEVAYPLLHAPRKNWSIIKLMMSLKLEHRLRDWFNMRLIHVESETAYENPSFELLCVALWLNEQNFLATLISFHHMSLPQYLATRNATDVSGVSIWFYAQCGLDRESSRNFSTASTGLRGRLPGLNSNIDLPCRDINTLRLQSTLYCDNPFWVRAFMDRVPKGIVRNAFMQVAAMGAWHGVLIGIMLNACDPVSCLAAAPQPGSGPNMLDYWFYLHQAPRTSVTPRSDSLNARDSYSDDSFIGHLFLEGCDASSQEFLSLPEVVTHNPQYPDLCLAYMVYQFVQPTTTAHRGPTRLIDAMAPSNTVSNTNQHPYVYDPKPFYGHCINVFLQNHLQEPRPAFAPLLVHLPSSVIRALNPLVTQMLRQQLEQFYPEYAVRILTPPQNNGPTNIARLN